jgi:hypothetical protein
LTPHRKIDAMSASPPADAKNTGNFSGGGLGRISHLFGNATFVFVRRLLNGVTWTNLEV